MENSLITTLKFFVCNFTENDFYNLCLRLLERSDKCAFNELRHAFQLNLSEKCEDRNCLWWFSKRQTLLDIFQLNKMKFTSRMLALKVHLFWDDNKLNWNRIETSINNNYKLFILLVCHFGKRIVLYSSIAHYFQYLFIPSSNSPFRWQNLSSFWYQIPSDKVCRLLNHHRQFRFSHFALRLSWKACRSSLNAHLSDLSNKRKQRL